MRLHTLLATVSAAASAAAASSLNDIEHIVVFMQVTTFMVFLFYISFPSSKSKGKVLDYSFIVMTLSTAGEPGI